MTSHRTLRSNALLLALLVSAVACHSTTAPEEPAAARGPEGAATSERLTDQVRLSSGTHQLTFSNWAGPELSVWLHVPENVDTTRAPITIVMHGAARDAGRYMRQWVPHAEERGVIVVAPKFSKITFTGAGRYNLGNVFDEARVPQEEAQWSFSAIEPLFDAVRAALGNTTRQYTLYGHSAGSQFVHRFLYYKPDARVSRYIAANAGWYTFPSLDIEFPYGLLESGLSSDALKTALGKDVIVLLGSKDNDANHRSLRRTAQALRQGPHRLARGMNFYTAGSDVAKENAWSFGWRLQIVDGVAHSNRGMAEAAINLVE